MLIICRAFILDSRGKTMQRQISHFLSQIIPVCKTKIISFVIPKMRTSAFSWKFCCWQMCLLIELRFNDDSSLIGIFARNIFYLSKQVAFLPLRTNSQHHFNWIAPWNCQIYEIRDALSLHLDWSDRSFHQFRSITDTLGPRRIRSEREENDPTAGIACSTVSAVPKCAEEPRHWVCVTASPGGTFLSLPCLRTFEEDNTFANNF